MLVVVHSLTRSLARSLSGSQTRRTLIATVTSALSAAALGSVVVRRSLRVREDDCPREHARRAPAEPEH